jgi:hypothetical protein
MICTGMFPADRTFASAMMNCSGFWPLFTAMVWSRSSAAMPVADSGIAFVTPAVRAGIVASIRTSPLTLSRWSGAYRAAISPPSEWPASTTGRSPVTRSSTPVRILELSLMVWVPFGWSLSPSPSRS